ncbi:MAG TPA: alpha/beta hydrolase [Streptosporangiaceae bacterium]|nr:alpha/beta hydrolase [Streptosporangiaceae bacterium]
MALGSATYQVVSEGRERRHYAPPGRLVDVGGHRMHIWCAGSGSPAVVIIPAIGGTAAHWRTVADAVAPTTAVCVYDRPGLDWSDAVARWPSAEGIARNLHDLLRAAAVAPPYVVVGHSLGGLAARMFTHLYPDEVRGMVLIDSSHPQQYRRLPHIWWFDRPFGILAMVALDFARPLGLRRLKGRLGAKPGLGQADTASASPHELVLPSRNRRAEDKEQLALASVCRTVDAIPGDLGDLPLAVVTSSDLDPNLAEGSEAQRKRSSFYPYWLTLQEELAALSCDGAHIVAPHAGHQVQWDDPDLVAKTIVDVALRAQSG